MKFLLVFILSFSFTAMANVIETNEGSIYLGEEYYQGKATGKTCYLQVTEVNPLERKGLHCNEIFAKFGFSTKNKKHVKDVIRTVSRITNYQSAEYPRLKTCADLVSDIPEELREYVTIYDRDDEFLYNQLFSWNKKVNGMDQHFFITFSSFDKTPKHLRLHGRTWFSEFDWDCKNLRNATPN